MRLLTCSLIISTLLLTACASSGPSSHYELEQNANQYVGDNIQSVIKQWGSANQAMHTAEGSSYYVYTTKTDTYGPSPLEANVSPLVGPHGQNIGVPIPASNESINAAAPILCTTTFKTNNQGTILWAKHQGSSCLGKWVNTTEK